MSIIFGMELLYTSRRSTRNVAWTKENLPDTLAGTIHDDVPVSAAKFRQNPLVFRHAFARQDH